MKRSEGLAMGTLLRICRGLMFRVKPDEARSYVDGLTDEELADVFEASSAAAVARGELPDLFCESAAARIRGIEVERYGSGTLLPEAHGEVQEQLVDKKLRDAGIKVLTTRSDGAAKRGRRSVR